MKLTRRNALEFIGSAAPVLAAGVSFAPSVAQTPGNGIEVMSGPFTNTRESLKSYIVPDWFADAKFGIWSHWGPQSAVGEGDWYARRMYIEGEPQYEYHVKRFGPQSRVGYKDLIPLFTADRWDPEHLMDLYAKAGAKYFFSMGVHHDNFDMWNSKYQPRWNAVASGPRKDIVGLWAAAARKRGLRFGVSEHLSNSFDWFAPAHLADTKGRYAGVPYDGSDSRFTDLYHDYRAQPADFAATAKDMGRAAPDSWKLTYFRRIKDLIDQHQPDLLYTDGAIPFEEYGLGTVAEIYNAAGVNIRNQTEGVYFSKSRQDSATGICILDRERGVSSEISPTPWQTDTCIGHWHYKRGQTYKTPKKVIDLLVDIVSKNGNLLLNFPLPASGELDRDEIRVLQGITDWMAVNGEGIYASRPWKINGEGPAMGVTVDPNTRFNEGVQPDLGAQDIRFTTKGQMLYAFVQGWPREEVSISALGTAGVQPQPKATDVRMLGRDEALKFTQDESGMRVSLPAQKPATSDIGITLRINFA
jgi:alpha-L-fucosidase